MNNITSSSNIDNERKCLGYCSGGPKSDPLSICGKGIDCINRKNIAGKIKPKDPMYSDVPHYKRKIISIDNTKQPEVIINTNEQYNKLVKDILEGLY